MKLCLYYAFESLTPYLLRCQNVQIHLCFRDILRLHRQDAIYLFTAIGLLPGGSSYFTCKQNMKLVTTRFKSGGLYEKHVVATWNVGNRLSICL